MARLEQALSQTFNRFFASKKAGGVVLITCTFISLILANSGASDAYLGFWHHELLGMSVEHGVNDGLMAIFFLLIGLELERELYNGELSNIRQALLPIVAAVGGIAVPAGIHFLLNSGTPTQAGMGIPMATDIAFALAVLALVGSRVPASLKIFLTALAVMDDLGAIIVIAMFYTSSVSLPYLVGAAAVFALMVAMNRMLHVMRLAPYLIGGALMWFLMLQSGVHATIAGVLLAFAIPYSAWQDDAQSPSHRLESALHTPVGYVILPIFALANTGVVIAADWTSELASVNSLGIAAGLALGKPIGITVASLIAVSLGVCRLPYDLSWRHVFGAGLLGGIGFTMSIFITNLAFTGQVDVINDSKIAILAASLVAGLLGFGWLKLFGKPLDSDHNMETMDIETGPTHGRGKA